MKSPNIAGLDGRFDVEVPNSETNTNTEKRRLRRVRVLLLASAVFALGAGDALAHHKPAATHGKKSDKAENEHGKLRFSPRDVAIAALIRRLLEAGVGIDGIRMLKRLAERDIRHSSGAGDATALTEQALRILYQRKAFREETGMDEEHYPEGKPPPPLHDGPPPGPGPRPRPGR